MNSSIKDLITEADLSQIAENPTYSTLEKIVEEYQKNNGLENNEIVEPQVEEQVPLEINPIPNFVGESQEVAPIPSAPIEEPIVNMVPNFEVPTPPVINTMEQANIGNPEMTTQNMSVAEVNPVPTQETPVQVQVPTFELPSLEMPQVAQAPVLPQNQQPIEFTGNLFDVPTMPNPNMGTTENFGTIPNTMVNTEIPVMNNAPFFGQNEQNQGFAPNPIPIQGNNEPLNQPPQMQTIFSQMQSGNYGKVA